MFYLDDDISKIRLERTTLKSKYNALLFAYHDRPYRTDRAREYATHGFLRRLRILNRAVDQVFTLLPVEGQIVPTDEVMEDATIALQAFIFNVFGCLDNLAWVWVEEKAVQRPDGTALRSADIGFGTKYRYVRRSFSAGFDSYLQGLKLWLDHLDNYRHALAHRIPLYIPPHFIKTEDEKVYSALQQEIWGAVLTGDESLEVQLRDRQQALAFFRPVMMHSFSEQAQPVAIHPQMLADFNTVDEVAQKLLAEMR